MKGKREPEVYGVEGSFDYEGFEWEAISGLLSGKVFRGQNGFWQV